LDSPNHQQEGRTQTETPLKKTCPQCLEEIAAAALRCKHCGAKQPRQGPGLREWLLRPWSIPLIFVALFFIVIICGRFVVERTERQRLQQNEIEAKVRQQSLRMCEMSEYAIKYGHQAAREHFGREYDSMFGPESK
jgi:hypothetical protein